jgi:CheY-like chemotaxis protein
VKFTPAGGSIHVGLARHDNEVEIWVADTGQGIAPDLLPRVFERLVYTEGPHTKMHRGLGLGLAIAKQLVELHAGTITAHSPNEHQGATFVVRLPLPKVPPVPTGKSPADHTDQDGLRGAHILVVEDDGETSKALAALLVSAGLRVTLVPSAAAALAAFESERPDLILSDIGLPEIDGLTLLRRIRAAEAATKARPVPAIAISTFAHASEARAALAAGYQDYLTKPADSVVLLATLARALQTP